PRAWRRLAGPAGRRDGGGKVARNPLARRREGIVRQKEPRNPKRPERTRWPLLRVSACPDAMKRKVDEPIEALTPPIQPLLRSSGRSVKSLPPVKWAVVAPSFEFRIWRRPPSSSKRTVVASGSVWLPNCRPAASIPVAASSLLVRLSTT